MEFLRISEFPRHSTFGIRRSAQRPRAFTLIELLVVISIIAILAALLFPAGIAVRNRATLNRAKAEIRQVESAITAYKIDKGFYPPDNPRNVDGAWQARLYQANLRTPAMTNSLYYELSGVKMQQVGDPVLPDGSFLRLANFTPVFGLGGVNNMELPGTEPGSAKNYLLSASSSLYAQVELGGMGNVPEYVIGGDVDGPFQFQITGGGSINPFRYVSSAPTNNTETFDLWVDVIVGGKTNRVCNWSDSPIVNP